METPNTTPENTGLELAKSLQGIELPDNHINNLIELYRPFAEEAVAAVAKASTIKVEVEGDEAGQAAAREARLELKNIRTTAEKTRKTNKKIVLAMSKANDLPYKAIEAYIKPVEELMQSFEDFDKNLKAARIEKLKSDRMEELNVAGLLTEETDTSMLGLMTPAMFNAFKVELQEAAAELAAAEKQAEEEAAAQAAELAALKEKNAALEAQAKQLKAEQEAAAMVKLQEFQAAQKLEAGPDLKKVEHFLNQLAAVQNPDLTDPKAINTFTVIAMAFDTFMEDARKTLAEAQN